MKPNTLASRVRSLRKSKHLTQQELAAMCCCSLKAINNIERGTSGGSSLLVRVLADALGVEAEALTTGEVSKGKVDAVRGKRVKR